MSLLKWKKLAKQKTELGNKINFVHDTILKKQLGEKTSQESFQKAFKPITTKLDEVAFRNLNIPRLTKKRGKKLGVPDYGIALEDEDIPDYGLDDFFDEGLVPENKKQIVPKPPTYEESLKDILEGKKQIYVDPQYFPEGPQDMPPKYEEDEEIDYALNVEDEAIALKEAEEAAEAEEAEEVSANRILDHLKLSNYDDIEKQLNQPEMTPLMSRNFLNRKVKDAKIERNRLNGLKAQVTHKYNKGEMSKAERALQNKGIDDVRVVLNQYIKYQEIQAKMFDDQMKKGSGLKKKKRGGNIVFFNDVKQLLKKLELIVGEILAGNTSIEMRNTGVAILDMLLKTSKINKAQHEKLYKTYFKI